MRLLISLLLIASTIPALLSGCFYAEGEGTEVTEEIKIPPIDAEAPAVTETATFALG
jgi:predicted small secreted protein